MRLASRECGGRDGRGTAVAPAKLPGRIRGILANVPSQPVWPAARQELDLPAVAKDPRTRPSGAVAGSSELRQRGGGIRQRPGTVPEKRFLAVLRGATRETERPGIERAIVHEGEIVRQRDQSERDRIQLALCSLWEVLSPPGSGRELPIETQRLYLVALDQLTTDEIVTACSEAMKRCKFFPKPAELIEMVRKSPRLSAIEAWTLVIDHCVGHIARKGPLDFGPLTNAAVRAIGGIDKLLTGTTTEHQNFTRPNFLRAYDELAQADTSDISGAVLIADGAEGKPVQRIGQAATDRPRIESKPDDAVTELAGKLRVEV